MRDLNEEGTTSTPFDRVVMNKLIEHKHDNAEHGEDLPEIRNWQWGAKE